MATLEGVEKVGSRNTKSENPAIRFRMRGRERSLELYLSIPAPGGNDDDESADDDHHGEGLGRHGTQGELRPGPCQAAAPFPPSEESRDRRSLVTSLASAFRELQILPSIQVCGSGMRGLVARTQQMTPKRVASIRRKSSRPPTPILQSASLESSEDRPPPLPRQRTLRDLYAEAVRARV